MNLKILCEIIKLSDERVSLNVIIKKKSYSHPQHTNMQVTEGATYFVVLVNFSSLINFIRIAVAIFDPVHNHD